MKSYTDIEQSKKLAEILPLESADMWWAWYSNPFNNGHYDDFPMFYKPICNPDESVPCWSLAALIKIIPKRIKDFNVLRIDIGEKDFAIWYDEIGYGVNSELPDITLESTVDACVEMIIKLHEQNLL